MFYLMLVNGWSHHPWDYEDGRPGNYHYRAFRTKRERQEAQDAWFREGNGYSRFVTRTDVQKTYPKLYVGAGGYIYRDRETHSIIQCELEMEAEMRAEMYADWEDQDEP